MLRSCRSKRTFNRRRLSLTQLESRLAPAIFTVTNTNDDGTGSLRQAILDANATLNVGGVPDEIHFNIAAAGVHTISPTSALPTITDPVVIDGYTQPLATVNTLAVGDNANLLIELNGANAGSGSALTFTAGNSTVRGLVINRFGQDAINLGSGSGYSVEGNFLGTDPTGSNPLGNGRHGVAMENGVSNSTVGGALVNARNLIAFNGVNFGTFGAGEGVGIVSGSSNVVQSNIILSNVIAGVVIAGGSGGTVTANEIALNQHFGVSVSGTGHTISLNSIHSNTDSGILLGGSGITLSANSIFDNGLLGIDLGGDGVTPNDVGDADTGPNNLQNFPVLTSAVTSGGTSKITGTLNSIANTNFRIEFFSNATADPSGSGEGQTFLGATTVTTDVNGDVSFSFSPANALAFGLFISSTATNLQTNDTSEFSADVCSAGPFTVVNTNNSGPGSLRQAILDTNAHSNSLNTGGVPDLIDFCILGSGVHTIAPASQLPALTDSVIIDGTTQPGFAGTPLIVLDGVSTAAFTIGLQVKGGNSTVRGLVIDRFPSDGIRLETNGGNTVAGNYIGIDSTGALAKGNGFVGVRVLNSDNNIIGGTTVADRNVIAGNLELGIQINSSSGTVVEGNFIGTNMAGTAAVGNGGSIQVSSGANTTIGGTTGTTPGGPCTGASNLISGNKSFLELDSGSSGTQILGNLIGTDAAGTGALGNGGGGIINGGSSGNVIGGLTSAARNVIAFNAGAGVEIGTGTGNSILGNSIFGNAALGIDIDADGVTPNDAGDGDTGANDLQNFPIITSAITNAGNTTIAGTLNSTPNTQFRLEFFANSVADPSGFGEGQLFIGFANVTTDVNGDASFNVAFANPGGPGITATATDPVGNTSEFSAIVPVPTGNTAPVITSLTGPQSAVRGQLLQYNGAFTDPDADTWTGTVNFGDGTGDQPLILNANKSFAFDYSFSNLGKFTVGVTVSDNHGGVGTKSLEITINNIQPVITNLDGPLSGAHGQSLHYSGAFTDPDGDTWTGTVNFGEGAGDQPLVLNADKSFAFDHVFANSGKFTIVVSVTDNHGGIGSDNLIVNITDVTPPKFTDLVAVGSGTNGGSVVRVYDAAGTLLSTFQPYDSSFHGEVHAATGDLNDDGVDDIVTGAGPGGGPHVQAFDGRSLLAGKVVHVAGPLASFFAYTAAFRGGVYVAVGDVNGDGHPDIVTGAGPGGGPHVIAYDGVTGKIITTFYAYDPAFTGGVSVAAGDILGTGHAEIVTGAGPGGGPHVRVFDGDHVVKEFFAYNAGFRGGVYVAAGDVTGDGKADIVTGAGAGGGPHVKVYDGSTLACVRSFFAYESIFTGGVRVATANLDADANAEIIIGAGPLGGPHVRYVDNDINNTQLNSFYSPDKDFNGGVFVG
jgi:PKD domain/Right handed beta helix region/FG-GAP repeat